MEKMRESVVQLQAGDGSQMAAFTAVPVGTPKAGMVVFQEAFGVNRHIQNIVRRLAGEGYAAIAPELFHRTAPAGSEWAYDDLAATTPHREALTTETLVADARAAYDWLQREGLSKRARVGCVGFCMGGRASFEANARLPLSAAVSFYGTRILTQAAHLAVDQKGPLLLIWGGKDKTTPPEKVKELTDALRAAGKDFINAEFSEAGHGFNCDERADYHPASAATAWAMTLAFLQKHL